MIDGAAMALQLVYVRPWQPGDLVMWDNRSTRHSATGELSRDERNVMHLIALNSSDPVQHSF
ncbi:MAG: TauD/TfdA family dioxygenase [Gammaproteobacteria bacterium]|nr:TauD/TfdA family dioxygenase [Gammaproteobacteria bacterium]